MRVVSVTYCLFLFYFCKFLNFIIILLFCRPMNILGFLSCCTAIDGQMDEVIYEGSMLLVCMCTLKLLLCRDSDLRRAVDYLLIYLSFLKEGYVNHEAKTVLFFVGDGYFLFFLFLFFFSLFCNSFLFLFFLVFEGALFSVFKLLPLTFF
ncbi:hypothetical protein, unlikely [Trypanosoma brucei gambiense DAL972]|uniref:Uncharacterized protein n=1 Tax=Trypanosoma brucei gambiense (strain MHOM/CI/86/DAL972) TaxID=679716 RepID=D0A3U5_TRYB9|nr:hypothetical protein, unlikely [Trypanosoma brucei gambiense DAL972]CBH15939.1 hypothetical protein, unlikely [Trypanosoma brucei gambiense DAL972]|eukprot:XP_011778203.1 hypothetical protein, unlikely [Trypanosoma brucei gambiense DAL972]